VVGTRGLGFSTPDSARYACPNGNLFWGQE
jgi:hypothetical protein